MLSRAKGKFSICSYTGRRDVHSQTAVLAVAPLYVPEAKLNRMHTVNVHLQMTIGSTCALLLLMSGERTIVKCLACYPARRVLKHEQNAITVSAKQHRKSLPALTTPLVEAWDLGGSVFLKKWLVACCTEMQV